MTTPAKVWNNVWGASPNDVFVSSGTAIYHYDGSSWTQQASPEPQTRSGIWGASGTSVWAVGTGGIWYYDGATWTVQLAAPGSFINGVWGSSATDVFAVGDNGAVRHFNGADWDLTVLPDHDDLNAVWGSGPNDVFAVGAGVIQHYDGSAWEPYATPAELRAVWGSGPNDVFAVGMNAILHYDGASWTDVTPAGVNTEFWGIAGSSGSDIYAVGYPFVGLMEGLIWHYDGSAWSRAAGGTGWGQLADIWGGGGAYYTVAINGGVPTGGQVWRCMGGGGGFTINATAGQGGAIAPTGAVAVNAGANQTFTITPDGGWNVLDVLVDGRSIGAVNSYTFTNVAANHTISADFRRSAIGPGSHSATVNMNFSPTTNTPVSLPVFAVTGASLSSNKAAPGETVTVTAGVINNGTAGGTTTVKLYVNGQEESSRGISLKSGSNIPVTFTVSRNEPGTYIVSVDGVPAGSFTVDQFADGNIILYISGALVLIAIVGAVIYVARRRNTA